MFLGGPIAYLLTMLLLLLGCSDTRDTDRGDTAADTADDTAGDTSGDTGDTGLALASGDCDVPLTDDAVPGVAVVYSGDGRGALFLHGAYAIETEAEWTAILALSELTGGAPATVDFATHRLLVASEWENSTCALSLVSAEVVVNNFGGPHLAVVIHDSSLGCEAVCDAEGGYAHVVAIPRDAGDFATVCRELTPGC